MARGKKTGGRDFQPGKEGGPGRPELSAIEKAARDSARMEIAQYWPDICAITDKGELTAIINDKTSPTVKKAMAAAAKNAIITGNLNELHKFYDRLLGKPKEAIEITDPDKSDLIRILREKSKS